MQRHGNKHARNGCHDARVHGFSALFFLSGIRACLSAVASTLMYLSKARPGRGQKTRPETKNIRWQALEVRSGRACVDERAARAERVSTHLERHRAQASKHGARDALAQCQMCDSAAGYGHGACTCTQEICLHERGASSASGAPRRSTLIKFG